MRRRMESTNLQGTFADPLRAAAFFAANAFQPPGGYGGMGQVGGPPPLGAAGSALNIPLSIP
jgi:hypothetical protein